MNGSPIEDGPKMTRTADGKPKWTNLEMPDLVSNLKNQKQIRDQMIAGGRPKEEAELKVEIESSGIAEHQAAISVLNACSEAGVQKVTFAFD